MKKLLGVDVSGSYTFNAAAQTITFSETTLTLANILLITNVTANTIIYNFADPSNGAVSLVNGILTLDHDTTPMSSNDVLQIYLDLESIDESLHALLRRMNKLLESNAIVDSSMRPRVRMKPKYFSTRAMPARAAGSISPHRPCAMPMAKSSVPSRP
jgi:hypothetical protein